MGFLSASATFTRFRFTEPVPKELWGSISAKLKQYSFKDIDAIPEERAWGWVNFDDMLDAAWTGSPPEKGEYLCFSLRLDTRRIPPAVLKKHTLLAVREEEKKAKEQGREYLSRTRKKEIQDAVKGTLMTRFLPIPAEFNVVWNTRDNIVYFASTQEKVIHLFTEFFSLTFDLDLEQLTPFALATRLMGEESSKKLENVELTRFV